MVDLAFLLITFFMLTTTLSKPQSMNLGLPDKEDKPEKKQEQKVDENRTLTILMGDNDQVKIFRGFLETPRLAPKTVAYGKDGLRKSLLEQKQAVLEYSTAKGKPDQGIIVIIKPTKKSSYRNLVDVLDEMAIVGVRTYAIVNEFSPEESKLISDGASDATTPTTETTPNP